MAFPEVHTDINSLHIHCQAKDISAALPSSVAYLRLPFRGLLGKVSVTIYGAITVANSTCTVAINGTNALGTATFTIPTVGSAAGNVVDLSFDKTGVNANYFNSDDILSFTFTGSTTACPATCEASVHPY